MEEVSEKGFVTFGDFYSEIRTHFSRNTVDFEEFKRRSSGKKKIEFLLDHSIVQEGLRKLSETGGSVKDRKVEEVLEPGNEPETPGGGGGVGVDELPFRNAGWIENGLESRL